MASTTKSGSQSKRGFASMDEAKQRAIASKGGKAAHEKGTAHEFDSAEAREAGRKGGEASHGKSKRRRQPVFFFVFSWLIRAAREGGQRKP